MLFLMLGSIASLVPLAYVYLSGVGNGPYIEARHQPQTHSEYYQLTSSLSFADYITRARQQITATHPQAQLRFHADSPLTVLDYIAPIAWQSEDFYRCDEKDKRGVLLIHGLSDSPFLLRDIAMHLQQQSCVLVRSLLLPGHGTIPGDLLAVDFDHWRATVSYGVEQMPVAHLYVAGYSTGAALALDYYLNNPNQKVRGFILLSPALGINNKLIGLVDIIGPLNGLFPQLKWWKLRDDVDVFKYESFPVNAAKQVSDLIQRVQQKAAVQTLNVPMLMVLSEDDSTVDPKAAVDFFDQYAMQGSQLILYQRGGPGKCFENDRYCFRRSSVPEKNVISFSHVAIPIAPQNFYYGEQAEYFNCSHHQQYSQEKARCQYQKVGDVPYSETNYQEGIVTRRMTYNPDFDFMMNKLVQFLQ